MFLCIQLCNSFLLNRAPQDVIEFSSGQNCVEGSVKFGNQTCKCNKGTIATGDNNAIECVEHTNVDGGKYTNLSYHSMQYFFLFHIIS